MPQTASCAIVRTTTRLTSPGYTYTAAEQAADFPAVAVRIYQVSAQVGRGFAAELACHGVEDPHGGTLGLAPDGEGTTFVIRLPGAGSR